MAVGEAWARARARVRVRARVRARRDFKVRDCHRCLDPALFPCP